jgi:hypothetical protein
LLAPKGDAQGFNVARPTYWAFAMVSNALRGTLLQGGSNQEALSAWMAKRKDGKVALLFVNKNPDSAYKTTLRVPGLKGAATVETLTEETSGGLVGTDPTGKTHPSTGPKSEQLSLADGSTLVIPKASVVTVRF